MASHNLLLCLPATQVGSGLSVLIRLYGQLIRLETAFGREEERQQGGGREEGKRWQEKRFNNIVMEMPEMP